MAGRALRPISLPGYPGLLDPMRDYAMRTGEPRLLEQVSRLESTLAGYVFTDGTIPSAIDPAMPLMQVVPSALLPEFWAYLARRLERALKPPRIAPRIAVRRSFGKISWTESAAAWWLTDDGAPLFTGIKSNPGAVFAGAEGPINLPPDAFPDDVALEEVRFTSGRAGTPPRMKPPCHNPLSAAEAVRASREGRGPCPFPAPRTPEPCSFSRRNRSRSSMDRGKERPFKIGWLAGGLSEPGYLYGFEGSVALGRVSLLRLGHGAGR